MGPWSDRTGVLSRTGRDTRDTSPFVHTQGRAHVRTQWDDSWMQTKMRALARNQPCQTLISGFQPPELWENKWLLRQPPSLGRLVMAAWADWCSSQGHPGARTEQCCLVPHSCAKNYGAAHCTSSEILRHYFPLQHKHVRNNTGARHGLIFCTWLLWLFKWAKFFGWLQL